MTTEQTSPPSPLSALYAITVAYGARVQICSPPGTRPDGRAKWQPVKAAALALGLPQKDLAWVGDWPRAPALLAKLKAIESDGAQDPDMREIAHFAGKILGLPLGECDVRRVLQHAFNVGQLLGILHRTPEPPDVLSESPALAAAVDFFEGPEGSRRYSGRDPFLGSPLSLEESTAIAAAMKVE